jgi:hypothetical protein
MAIIVYLPWFKKHVDNAPVDTGPEIPVGILEQTDPYTKEGRERLALAQPGIHTATPTTTLSSRPVPQHPVIHTEQIPSELIFKLYIL